MTLTLAVVRRRLAHLEQRQAARSAPLRRLPASAVCRIHARRAADGDRGRYGR